MKPLIALFITILNINFIMSQNITPLSKQVVTANGTLHYLEYGSTNKEIIFLLHGIPGSSHCFDSLAIHLSSSYRAIVPDMLGFGKSSKPVNDYYTNAQATAYSELYNSITSDSIIVFGHDFGGPAAITLIKDFSNVKIKKLILASTNMFVDAYVPPPMRLAKVPVLGHAFFWLMTGNRMGTKMMYNQGVKNKATYTLHQYKKSITKSGMKYTMRIFRKSLSNLKLHYQSIQDHLANIIIPVLVLWGDSDPFFAVDVGQRTKNALKNSRLIVYKSTGHFVPSEQPAAVFQDINKFINEK